MAVPHAAGARTREIRRALGRILLFLLLFMVLTMAGTLLVPAAQEETPWGLFAGSLIGVVAAFAAGALLLRLRDGRKAGALGLAWTRSTPRELWLGFVIGVLALSTAMLLLLVTGSLAYHAEPGTLADWSREAARSFVLLLPAALAEELLFRGYAFQWLARAAGPGIALVLGSIVFAAAHLANPDPGVVAIFNLFLAGVLLGAAYLRTRSLWFATSLHLGWNWMMAAPLDLPVSGIDLFDAPIYEPVIAGPVLFNGGRFGPEGGLAATIALCVAVVAVWKYRGLREPAEMRALSPLVDVDDAEDA